jgi:hypothetical protein
MSPKRLGQRHVEGLEGNAMVDISALASALSSLKAAKDIGEAMIGLRDAATFQAKLLEFQSKLIDANNAAFAAQDERVALLERVGALEEEIAHLRTWEADKERYELKEVGSGAFTYVLKEAMRGGEPIHWLCANCYQQGKKRLLQAHGEGSSFFYHICPDCSGKINIPKPPTPPQSLGRSTMRRV